MSLCLFIASVEISLYFYTFIIVLSDLTFACSFATLGLVAATIFRLKFVLPFNGLSKLWQGNKTTPKSDSGTTSNEIEKPLIAAHRTLALECPENSLSGIRQAAQCGFQAVEFDVRFSRDGLPIIFHDNFIDRVTTEYGKVEDLSLEQLQLLDISGRHLRHKTYEKERIPTLKEAIDECLSLNLTMIIDVKIPNAKMVQTLSDVYKTYQNLDSKSLVVSVSPLFLYKFKKRNPTVTTGLVWRPRMLSLVCPTGNLEHGSPRYREKWKQLFVLAADPVIDWMYNNLLWYISGADVFLAHRDAMNREYVRMWKTRNMPLLAWPVNNPIEKNYFANVLQVGYLTDTHMPFL